MCPVYVPATSVPVSPKSAMSGALPLVGLTVSQVAESLAAVKLSVPPPVLLTLTDVAAGLMPLPCVALNERAAGESVNTGGGAATLKVTVIVAGEPVDPELVTVTCPGVSSRNQRS